MDEIEKRLRESTDACIKSFEDWVKASKSLESREVLMETMHEVRKVISRVEIEIAISERDRLGSRPIPIPAHRSQRKREGGEDAGGDDQENYNFDEQQPQMVGGGQGGGGNDQRRQQHHNRGQRRPMHGRGGQGGGGQGGGGNGNNGNSDNAQ